MRLYVTGWLLVGVAGSLAVWTGSEIALRLAVLPVDLPSGVELRAQNWDQGYVYARGTWVFEGERQASPLQTSEVVCFRDELLCTNHQADLLLGFLNVNRFSHPITRWTADRIEFGSDTSCVAFQYVIDRAFSRVTGRRTKKADASDLCDYVSPGSLQLALRDGSAVHRELVERIRSEHRPFVWIALAVVWLLVLWRIVRTVSRKEATEASSEYYRR